MAKTKKTTTQMDAKSGKANHGKHPKSGEINDEVIMDRRAAKEPKERRKEDRRKADIPVAVDRRQGERRAKVSRRRQIDPTTCERDYQAEEIEFMTAMDQYKRTSGRMFPTCSEVLEVLRALGYEKRAALVEPVNAPAPVAAVADVTMADVPPVVPAVAT